MDFIDYYKIAHEFLNKQKEERTEILRSEVVLYMATFTEHIVKNERIFSSDDEKICDDCGAKMRTIYACTNKSCSGYVP